ncbi:MAG TPA: hypothetical protein PKK05_22810, partial [Leptospiraceae bacterium]|nr:hypothetical protein [Leptospiraceae bacterium]
QKFGYADLNALAGSDPTDSAIDSLVNLALAQAGEFTGNAKAYGFKTTFSTNQITVGIGVIVSPAGVFRFAGNTYTVNPSAGSGVFEAELSTLYDSPITKEYINVMTDSIGSAVGNSRKNFQMKIYENYTGGFTPPSVTAGRVRLFEYVMTAPGGNVSIIQNPVVNSQINIGRVPLGAIVYCFDTASIPVSGTVSADGFMIADGSTVPSGYAKTGWTTPNLTAGYIEGSTSINTTGLGTNLKTLTLNELPQHGHSITGTGTFVEDVNFLGLNDTKVGYTKIPDFNDVAGIVANQFGFFAVFQKKSNVGGLSVGIAGAGLPFDVRPFHYTGVPLVRVD